MKWPVIGITCGDPGGIGPEVVLKSLLDFQDLPFIPVIMGDDSIFEHSFLKSLDVPLTVVSDLSQCVPGSLYLLRAFSTQTPYVIGDVAIQNGQASLVFAQRAVELAHSGQLDAIVTAPIHKKSWQMAGSAFTGHTSMLQSLSGCSDVSMAFYTPQLKVVLATVHIPLSTVSSVLNEAVLDRACRHAVALSDQVGNGGKIALAGLNPHAGESGMFGTEEETLLIPFVDQWNQTHAQQIEGPISPDTVFYRAYHGEFDVVVSLYHDQGLIPVKLLGFDHAVNVSMGLPFIRTSPDHGTAFDIAYQGAASPESMKSAIQLAVNLVKGSHNAS